MPIVKMTDLNLQQKRVLIRVDLNVPLNQSQISSDTRIRAVLPTIQLALKQGAKILLLSHLGRPQEGKYDPEYSLAPVAKRLSELLQHPVRLQQDWLEGVNFTNN
jgi:phosphoglycerate kinase